MKNFIFSLLLITGFTSFGANVIADCDAAFAFEVDGLTVTFIDESVSDLGPILEWVWDFGDGTTSGLASPTHTYAFPGEYDVCLTIYAAGCDDTKCESNIPAGLEGECFATFTYSSDGLMAMFTNDTDPGPGDVTSYLWTFGDGSSSEAANPNHTYAMAGTYGVCLSVVFADGCEAEFCTEIMVDGVAGDCNVTASLVAVDGMLMHFLASVTPAADAVTYTWTFGDGSSFTETTAGTPSDPWHTYGSPGVYNVCVVIETGAGCVDEYCFEVAIDGGGDCEAGFEFDTDLLTATFFEAADGAGSEIISYYWSFGDGSSSDAPNPTHVYDLSGTYLVCLTITTADGCINTVCEEVDVESGGGGDCDAAFDVASITDTGSGWAVTLENNSSGSEIYFWTFGDGGTSEATNPEHLYDEPGIYTICLTIGLEGGDCFDTKCDEIYVGGGVDCINPALIDTTYGCVDVYEPVCGCDGLTYENSCFAIFYGGVVFYTDGACAGTSIDEENIIGAINVYPNPAQNSATVNYQLTASGLVSIQVMDITGKAMIDPIAQQSATGTYHVVLNTTDYAAGIYFIHISTNGIDKTEKLIITK